MTNHPIRRPDRDHELVGDCETDAEKQALWRARSWRFKLRRTANVLSAVWRGQVPAARGWFALRHPAQMVALAIRASRGGGMVPVCPAAASVESGEPS